MDSADSRPTDLNSYRSHRFVDQDDPASLRPPTTTASAASSTSTVTIHSVSPTVGSTSTTDASPVDNTIVVVEPESAAQETGVESVEAVPPSSAPASSVGMGLVKLARPHQWIKNTLVFVAPAAAGVLLHWSVLWHAAAAFGIFCLAASGTYFLNDAMDVQADRLHPRKRFRPVAAGIVAPSLAIGVGVAMLAVAIGLGGALAGYGLAIVMALYAATNIGYSIGLKNEPILDLALVCAGFVLRAIAGGVATGVALSNWFIIVASFGSLVVVAGKRSGEKKLLSTVDVEQRSVRQTLGLYTPEFLRSVLVLSAAVTVTAYCLWAFERASQVGADHHPIWFQLSIIPFVVALLHVVRLLDSGAGAAPEDLALHDRRLQIYGICWIALFAAATYS